MRPIKTTFGILALSAALIASSASAQVIDELRFGGSWAQPEFIDAAHPEANQVGITGELLFVPFDFDSRAGAEGDFLNAILTPRFHIGGTANLSNRGTSYGYAGLTWHFGLTERLFVETSFGASVNNGLKDGKLNVPETDLVRARIGSNILFRESVALGYKVSDQVSVLLQLDHNSHAGLWADKNRGLTATHLKLGYKF